MKKNNGNLIFIGMMGTGKTSVGKECSRILSREFFDTDEVYEKKFGSIADTFDTQGESCFRRRESEILEELGSRSGVVIACGGGAVLSDKFDTLANTGTVIWLTATPEIISARIAECNNAKRPLNKGEDSIRQIFLARESLYKRYADITIDTNSLSVFAVAANCIKALAL